jgi:hypothetical protein
VEEPSTSAVAEGTSDNVTPLITVVLPGSRVATKEIIAAPPDPVRYSMVADAEPIATMVAGMSFVGKGVSSGIVEVSESPKTTIALVDVANDNSCELYVTTAPGVSVTSPGRTIPGPELKKTKGTVFGPTTIAGAVDLSCVGAGVTSEIVLVAELSSTTRALADVSSDNV